MKDVVLHIGTPKTGSTALQKTFSKNRSALHRAGVLYPGRGSMHSFILLLSRKGSRDPEAAGGNPRVGRAYERSKEVRAEVAASPAGQVIFSCEWLSELPAGRLPLLSKLARDVGGGTPRVLVYVRHPVSFALSVAQERIKKGYGDIAEHENQGYVKNFRAMVRAYQRVFGEENVVVREYDRARLVGGSIQSDAIAAVGMNGVSDLGKEPLERNVSLSMNGVIVAGYLNHAMARAGIETTLQQHQPTIHQLHQIDGPKFTFSAAALDRLEREAAKDIAWFRRRFGFFEGYTRPAAREDFDNLIAPEPAREKAEALFEALRNDPALAQ